MDLSGMWGFLKILGPAYGAFLGIFGGLGYFIMEIYKFNVTNKITDAFPSQFAIYLFFILALFAGLFILVVITLQSATATTSSRDNTRKP